MQDDILKVMETKGPIMPSDINSEFKTNTTIIGAMLSELAAQKKIIISTAKIGGSPLYYLPQHRDRLDRLYQYLNQKDKRTYDLLKQSIVLYNEDQDPLTKTSLDILKDFAVPLNVVFNGKEMLFWKWYLCDDNTAKLKIKEILDSLFPVAKEEKVEPKKEIKKEIKQEAPAQNLNASTEALKQTEVKQEPIASPKVKKTPTANTPKTEKATTVESFEERLEKLEKKQEVAKSLTPKTETASNINDVFLDELKVFFTKIQIKIVDATCIKKKSDFDLIVILPSAIGELKYYCKAQSKLKISEGDLASAYLEGQMKNLPVIYASKGDLPKKIEPLLESKFKGLKILKIVSE